MIYKNWKDYWTMGKHGYSSAGREDAKAIWDDFQETINAKRGDYEKLLIANAEANEKVFIERVRETFDYLEQFDLQKHAPIKFFRWLIERARQ